MKGVRKNGSLKTNNITSIEKTSEQKKKSSLKSNKTKLTEHSIYSCNNPSKENSYTIEEEEDSIIRKNSDSSSTIPKEHDPDLKLLQFIM